MPIVALPPPSEVIVPSSAQATLPWHRRQWSRVVHVGQSAVLLAPSLETSSDDDLLVLSSARRGLVPGGVCVPQTADFDRLVAGVARALGPDSSGHPDGALSIDLTGWASLTAPAIRVTDLRLTPVLPDHDALSALLEGCQTAANAPASGAIDPRPLRAHAKPLAHAALSGDRPTVALLLRRLVGAGPGATPTGDDVVVGVLATLHAVTTTSGRPVGIETRATELLATLLTPLLSRTTQASRNDLRAALSGEFSEHVHELVRCLHSPGLVPGALRAARRWGATSGIDLATAVAAAARVATTHIHTYDAAHDDRRSA